MKLNEPGGQVGKAHAEIISDFRSSWRIGDNPDIAAFLGRTNVARLDLLTALIEVELEIGLEQGHPRSIERFIQRFPELQSHRDRVLDILICEHQLKKRLGQAVTFEEFIRQLSGLSRALRPTQLKPTATGSNVSNSQTRDSKVATGVKTANQLFCDATVTANKSDFSKRYKWIRRLGGGAFGVVYQVQDVLLGRDVAIKVPKTGTVISPADLHAFADEARFLAVMDHPGIVSIFDVVNHAGSIHIVSKFVQGTDLASRLRQGGLSQKVAAELVMEMADALSHAHQRGIVHLDIKPGNVIIDADGRPCIVDFGLAKFSEKSDESRSLRGTPSYMSPEQARNDNHLIGPSSDVFSLGVVFYELLTGRRPFRGANWNELKHQICTGTVSPPSSFNSEITTSIDRICLKCLSKQVRQRYRSAAELYSDLKEALSRNLDDSQRLVRETMTLVPRGLRCFTERDAEGFASLLPGPRARDGVPESINFWLSSVEQSMPTGFRVGVLFGPSGSGKSSLIRAGVIPRLSDNIAALIIEATPIGTGARLLSSIRANCPGVSAELDLPSTLQKIRDDWTTTPGRKLLIVIDQFEQWLSGKDAGTDSSLVQALMKCDGENVLALLLCRDEYAIATSRILNQIDITLHEGENFQAVAPFDTSHAEKVLRILGSAMGKLPERDQDATADQYLFLKTAVKLITNSGEVVAVRLAVFIQLFRDRDWTAQNLAAIRPGIEFAFLNEIFFGAKANPKAKQNVGNAQVILKQLLPPLGSDIKESGKGLESLRLKLQFQIFGSEFDELIDLLSSDLKLITLSENLEVETSSTQTVQLAHDYLVAVVRTWINQRERETIRGRANLRLSEVAEQWKVSEEKRHLPSLFDWARIHALAPRQLWSRDQGRMMHVANRYFFSRLASAGILFLVAAFAAQWVFSVQSGNNLVRMLTTAESVRPDIIEQIVKKRNVTSSILAAQFDVGNLNHLLTAYALHGSHIELLVEALLAANPRQIEGACRTLSVRPSVDICQLLWTSLTDSGYDNERFNATIALSGLVGEEASLDVRWRSSADTTVDRLISSAVRDVDDEEALINLLNPNANSLYESLKKASTGEQDPERRNKAITLSASFFMNDSERLVGLLPGLEFDELKQLFPAFRDLKGSRKSAIEKLKTLFDSLHFENPTDTAIWEPVDQELKEQFARRNGLISERFAFCPAVSAAQFAQWVSRLKQHGYRPTCCRPYLSGDKNQFAALWHRDGQPFFMIVDAEQSDLEARNSEKLDDNGQTLVPIELVGYPSERGLKYLCLWGPGNSEKSMDHCLHFDIRTGDLRNELINKFVREGRLLSRFSMIPGNRASMAGISSLAEPAARRIVISKLNQIGDKPTDFNDWLDLVWLQETPQVLYRWQFDQESILESELSGAELAGLCVTLCAQGYHPHSLWVHENEGEFTYSAIWRRDYRTEQEQDELAKSRINAALVLASMGDTVWIFRSLEMDVRMRTYAIHGLDFVLNPAVIWKKIKQTENASVRQALLLALSERSFRGELGGSAITELVELYRTDPSSGVHSAAERLLHRLQINADSEVISQTTKSGGESKAEAKQWRVNSIGQTMITLPAGSFFQGSLPTEPYHHSQNEELSFRTIERDFEISSTEVTVEQFREFNKKYTPDPNWNIDPNSPAGSVTWIDAALYCNWLSRKEGLQFCYPDQIGEGTRFDKDLFARNGYRLPSRSEWEYACRAGTKTPRYYGFDEKLLPHYAWIVENSNNRAHPVGLLMPNQWGLFGTYGNASEWCFDALPNEDALPHKDALLNDSWVLDYSSPRILCGGTAGWPDYQRRSRSAFINGGLGTARGKATTHFGFRIARTISN